MPRGIRLLVVAAVATFAILAARTAYAAPSYAENPEDWPRVITCERYSEGRTAYARCSANLFAYAVVAYCTENWGTWKQKGTLGRTVGFDWGPWSHTTCPSGTYISKITVYGVIP
jgi:hypothetical protein